ncbi:Asp23/Gls24 family envelope stress response protein [Allorhizocola rhizosphaerae]|uniref:Asp23/Gls24 family envelope stress response protein n=1 Tax=Allorhizocola rhizosphaerae TaxID=1872709 RepID=UPI000E3D8744|nr:Asp23/Gls24 family envelope stress response protein [Allorhizocola rhizosphaerae]
MTTEPIAPESPTAVEPTPAADVQANFQQRGREAVERINDAAHRAGDAVERAIVRVRNTAALTEERGVTTIADEVVGKIAGIAAREIAGVHDLGGDFARGFAFLTQRIGLGDADGGSESDRGVRVRLEGTTAIIDMTIVIEFGYVVHSVTDAVRVKVIAAVENMLGLEVLEVNIRVDDVHVADDKPATA